MTLDLWEKFINCLSCFQFQLDEEEANKSSDKDADKLSDREAHDSPDKKAHTSSVKDPHTLLGEGHKSPDEEAQKLHVQVCVTVSRIS